MTDSPLETAIRKALNDRALFSVRQEAIGNREWEDLREAVSKGDRDGAVAIIERAEGALRQQGPRERDRRGTALVADATRLLEGLRRGLVEDSPLARQAINLLDRFGCLECNIRKDPAEDLGRVIEYHSWAAAEQCFLAKIDKEGDRTRKAALASLLRIVKELRAAGVELTEIAFFVRKLDSLKQIVEVLR